MEIINDRMERLVNEMFGGNKAAFARKIGITPALLSNYLGNQRRSKPSVDMAAKIVTTLNVDARWLLTGEGEASLSGNAIVNGDHSAAAVNGNATVTDKILEERVRSLQEQVRQRDLLLSEKERLIQVLLKSKM